MKDENNKNKYWQDVENKVLDPEVLKSEFAEGEGELQFDIGSVQKSRRSFLSVMGFSLTALPLASCIKIPVKKALPYLKKNSTVVPGVANWYATTMDPMTGTSLLVKTREGRPIKIEGNDLSPLGMGATMPTCQASVLSLYDSFRYRAPKIKGVNASWSKIDQELIFKLNSTKEKGKEITLVTRSVSSPSYLRAIEELKKRYDNLKHVVYDPGMYGAIISANKQTFGNSNVPSIHLENAEVIVSFSADFLGTWLNPGRQTKGYSKKRDLVENKTISKHYHFESLMTLTGSNADERFTVSRKEEADFIINLLARLQMKSKTQYLPQGQKLPATNSELVEKIASELYANRGKSIVLSGSEDTSVQILVNAINDLLSNYSKTIKLQSDKFFAGANDLEFENFVDRATQAKVGTVLFLDVNPAYSYFNKDKFSKAMSKVVTKVSFATSPDETSKMCDYVMPSNHALESWADYVFDSKYLSFSQPVIQPMFSTRMGTESLLVLAGINKDYNSFMKETSKTEFFTRQSKYLSFTDFWNRSVHDGFSEVKEYSNNAKAFDKTRVVFAFSKVMKMKSSELTFISYEKVGMRKGDQISNPWLQELPDPITKATWDNYIMISPKRAKELSLKSGSVVSVSDGKTSIELPVVVQPGVEYSTIAIAVGYGRKVTGKAGINVGENVYPFFSFKNGTYQGLNGSVSIKKSNKFKELALTQTHHSMEGRDIVKETTLKEWSVDNKSGNKHHIELISMWKKHDKSGEQWAMAIDLNKCTGCSGCIVSCNAENNVPVVGREEVKLRREMHWLRIDRYYAGDENNPEVVHQPVMCQHCDNAPCETVCPVLATVQSTDGLNQQVYNRCVGTRYCANNCAYKVRRFNWFDYPHNDQVANLVLNPDVVVRSRGVMEKCSMCIQRIQEGRLESKKSGKALKDGDIRLACQQSCAGDAIVFGDMNDPKSKIAKLMANARSYRLLEEINLETRVNYLTKVRNKG